MVLLRGSKLSSLLALAGSCSTYSRTILVLSFLMRLSLFLSIQIVQLIIPPENVSMLSSLLAVVVDSCCDGRRQQLRTRSIAPQSRRKIDGIIKTWLR